VAHGGSEGVLHVIAPIGVEPAVELENELVAGFLSGDVHRRETGGFYLTIRPGSARREGGNVMPRAAAFVGLTVVDTLGTVNGICAGFSPRMTRSISETATSPQLW